MEFMAKQCGDCGEISEETDWVWAEEDVRGDFEGDAPEHLVCPNCGAYED